MKPQTRFVSFEPDAIRDLVKEFPKESLVKLYELVIGYAMHQHFEQMFKQKCGIALEIEEKLVADLPADGQMSLAELKKLVIEMVKQDSSIDIAITVDGKAIALQLKRFGYGKTDTSQKEIADFLNSQYKKYSLAKDVYFVIIFEGSGEIVFEGFEQNFNAEQFPFGKVLFVLRNGTNGQIIIGELWPHGGMNEYQITKESYVI